MEAFLFSTLVVAIAEIGDKTQLLALLLAARFRRPVPIILGTLVATIANHALAAWLGLAVSRWIGPDAMRWILGGSFLAMALWALIPDKASEGPGFSRSLGPFLTSLIAFFVLEIGDKTQVATIALAARYETLLLVTIGTTLGMMIANVPVVLLGNFAATRLPLKLIRTIAAGLFALAGIATLVDLQLSDLGLGTPPASVQTHP